MLTDDFDIEQAGSCVTIHVRSEEAFQSALDAAGERMRYDKAQQFVFDLEQVRCLPSACLGALLNFQQEVEHCRGRIALVHSADSIATLFRVTQLDEVFGLFDDIEQALASLTGLTR